MESNAKNMSKSKKERFKRKEKEDRDKIMEDRVNDNTKKVTKIWMKCFNDYLTERDLPDQDTISSDDLPKVLEEFYTELRKVDGEQEYKTSTLKCIRAAINRYYKEHRSIDLLQDGRFVRSNEMFKGVTKKAKQEGRGETESTPPIEPEDMALLAKYFEENLSGPPNAIKLQQMVIFNTIYYMCRRGRQNLRPMTKETFQIATDASGKRYIYQAIKEQDKNHKEDDLSANNEARIYENTGNYMANLTPVNNYEKKLKCCFEHLTQNNSFFFQLLLFVQ